MNCPPAISKPLDSPLGSPPQWTTHELFDYNLKTGEYPCLARPDTPDSLPDAQAATAMANFHQPHRTPVRPVPQSPESASTCSASPPLAPGTPRLRTRDRMPRVAPMHPSVLGRDEEHELTEQIVELFMTKLVPSLESIEKRKSFMQKVKRIFKTEWPSEPFKVYLFGSSCNKLATSTSDVDICISTESSKISDVRVLAKVLRKNGMCSVRCVFAKVQIVRFWDPALRLACDININNTVALHNTRMIKTFVDIDPRVQPLTMVIKYWASRRAVNDAGVGGTLSPYTWVNLLFSFLQRRSPPVLPVLHPSGPVWNARMADYESFVLSTQFDDDIAQLIGYGTRNTETLGRLLYEFFRTFAYDFDYRNAVVSLRHGRLLAKSEKDWDHGRFAGILCIEEPFDVRRNLGNSADIDSLDGIRGEFERAVRCLELDRSVETLCQAYYTNLPIYPKRQHQPRKQPRRRQPASAKTNLLEDGPKLSTGSSK